jgi:hypothetical protein
MPSISFIIRLRVDNLRDMRACPSPFATFLLLQPRARWRTPPSAARHGAGAARH